MTRRDFTIDSCVIGHAQNPLNDHFECAVELFEAIVDRTDIQLVVDSGGLLWSEWETEFGDMSLPAQVLVELVNTDRIREVDLSDLHPDDRRWVKSQIRSSKPRDRTILIVSMIHRGVLVTDDFADFTADLRRRVRRRCGLITYSSCEAVALA